MKLSELTRKPVTFTVKHDFNMNGFLLESKLQETFEILRIGAGEFKRTNTSSNIKLKDNLVLNEDAVCRLIEAGRTVSVFSRLEARLDVYNYGDDIDLLNLVVKY